MKLKKGSAEAKRYMQSIRAKKKISGINKINYKIVAFPEDLNYKYYVVNEDKNNFLVVQFDNLDIYKKGDTYKKNLFSEWIPKNEFVIIKKNNMKKLGSVKASAEVKKTLKAKKLYMPHGYKTAKRKRAIGEVHADTKSHNVKIDIISGVNPYIETIKKGIVKIQKEIEIANKQLKEVKTPLLKKSILNRKKFLMSELSVGKQLLKKF